MDPIGSISHTARDEKINEGQEQFTLRRDVELQIHALFVILDRIDTQLESLGNFYVGVANQDEMHDIAFPWREFPLQERAESGLVVNG
jgi:hypothetical protein